MYLFYSNDDEEEDGKGGGDPGDGAKPKKRKAKDEVTKPDVTEGDGAKAKKRKTTDEPVKPAVTDPKDNDDNKDFEEGEEIVIRRSKRLKVRSEMDDFIVQDYKEKRKSYRSRKEEARRRREASAFILDQSSITFRAVSGYYGNFGEKDHLFDDQKDFEDSDIYVEESSQEIDLPELPKNKKKNFIHSDDEDELTIGDVTLRNNISKNIQYLEAEDIDVDIFEAPVAPRTPSQTPRRGRGGRKVRGRGRGKQTNKIGNDHAVNKEDNEVFVNGSFLNTEVPSKRDYDSDIFTAESSTSVETADDKNAVQGQDQQANEGQDQQANEGQDQSANEDEALLGMNTKVRTSRQTKVRTSRQMKVRTSRQMKVRTSQQTKMKPSWFSINTSCT